MKRAAWAWALALVAACATVPRDPFAAAESAMRDRDLAAALRAFDAVPVAHARYPEARAQALAVESSLRRCHELMLQAMRFRAEWRDHEALAALAKAQAIWPGMPGAQALADATEQRLQLFPNGSGDATRPPGAAVVVAAPPSTAPAPPAAPAAEGARSRTANANDAIAAGLAAIEARLAAGGFEPAVADLLAMASRHPDDARVRSRLARVLHQRALLRYGDGRVELAIADWRRVLELEPGHATAWSMLQAAEGER